MAEAIFNHKIAEKGLADFFESDSAGTGNYHVGRPADSRTISAVERMGVRITHRARQVTKADLSAYDYILAMDIENRRMLHTLAEADQELGGSIYLMRDFDQANPFQSEAIADPGSAGDKALSVPDPYYGGEEGFQEVYQILDHSLVNFIDFLTRKHQLQPHVR